MKYNQNHKISQIAENTLVVGVDIAKKKHYARAFDYRGMELDKVIKFKANGGGFESFINWTESVAKAHGKKKIVVGIEPTGHYWYTFGRAVIDRGLMLVQVNPYHVKKTKELDDNTPSKSDYKDPKTIAFLVKDGRYQIPYMPDGKYAELRKANNLREEWVQKKIKVKNKITRWLDIHFPEFLNAFSSWEGKTALMTLGKIALPEKIASKTPEEILCIWRKEVRRGVGIKKAEKLVKEAQNSVGIREGAQMAEYEIKLYIKEYMEIREVLEDMERKLEKIVLTIPGANRFLEIKGVGIKTVAGFFAEIGDIKRFTSAKQIIKLAGLNLRQNSSGQHKGETTISKRGRSRLRALLFRAILPIVATNEVFNKLHHDNISQKERPMKKMQSLIALCCRLIRIVYSLITKDQEFDPDKLIRDIHRDDALQGAA
jgi:transposase